MQNITNLNDYRKHKRLDEDPSTRLFDQDAESKSVHPSQWVRTKPLGSDKDRPAT